MKLLGAICIGMAAAFFAIGINESIYRGVQDSYFLFMFSLVFLFGYGYIKRHEIAKANAEQAAKVELKKKKK